MTKPMMRGGVRLRGVSKTYGEGAAAVHALREVDLDIPAGELMAILGPSGSGKTTLLNVIGGIESANSGTIVVAGQDISGRPPRDLGAFRRAHVGFVFQFFNLIPTLTAYENVEVVIELTGRGDRGRVPDLLAAVGLSDRADHFPAAAVGWRTATGLDRPSAGHRPRPAAGRRTGRRVGCGDRASRSGVAATDQPCRPRRDHGDSQRGRCRDR